MDDGYRFLRFGVTSRQVAAGVWDQGGVAMAERLRSALGDAIELCFDAHTTIDVAMALRFARELAPYRLFCLEDPIRSENAASLATLARHTT